MSSEGVDHDLLENQTAIIVPFSSKFIDAANVIANIMAFFFTVILMILSMSVIVFKLDRPIKLTSHKVVCHVKQLLGGALDNETSIKTPCKSSVYCVTKPKFIRVW